MSNLDPKDWTDETRTPLYGAYTRNMDAASGWGTQPVRQEWLEGTTTDTVTSVESYANALKVLADVHALRCNVRDNPHLVQDCPLLKIWLKLVGYEYETANRTFDSKTSEATADSVSPEKKSFLVDLDKHWHDHVDEGLWDLEECYICRFSREKYPNDN